jgi:bifunctional DNA-binding transcriptional regulator/antitoxin component of YhaV-PrlF toxin-antitoxin module
MQAIVSITNQGQITVPVDMRRYLKMGKREKIKATLVGEKIVLEKMVDIDDLAGVFASQAKKITKGMTRKEIASAERKAIEDGWTSRFKK